MDPHVFVPLALFACVTYAFKAILDATLRYRLLRAGGSPDLVRAILEGEERQRRVASLRWGLVTTAIGLGFGIVKVFGWTEISAGVVAVLAVATGVGNLAFYVLCKRL